MFINILCFKVFKSIFLVFIIKIVMYIMIVFFVDKDLIKLSKFFIIRNTFAIN
jgi:hypothetical protein